MESLEAISALRALADTTRLQVARLLVEGPFSVSEIQDVLGLGQSTVSHHLKVLADAGLLACRREGRLAWYGWEGALSPAGASLKQFVQLHARTIDAPARRRLGRVFDARGEGTRRFFDGAIDPSTTPPASVKAPAPAVDVVARMMALLPKSNVAIDLGTGVGRLLGPLRERAKRVLGVDQSPRMLDGAARLVSQERWPNVELRLGALEHLPVADGEADLAIAHQVLHHLAQPEKALAEAHRALRAGGGLVVADYLPHEREWMRDEYADLWLGFAPAHVTRLLEEAGFAQVGVESRPGKGDELGMFVAHARRGPDGPALVHRSSKEGPRPRRAGRQAMPQASERTRRR